MKHLLMVAALLAGLAVLLGAFGAHALQEAVPADRWVVWQTAVRYQMWHALALLFLAQAPFAAPWAARALLGGTMLFSGSLYLLVLSDQGWLGALTPIGGLSLLAGWLLIARAALGHHPSGAST